MKTFTIGKTRSRTTIALVCAGTLAAAIAMAIGCAGGAAPEYLAEFPPVVRSACGGVLVLMLGLLALSSIVTSSSYWRLTESEICCRSLSVSSDWPRYTYDLLRGREPEVDIRIATADVERIRLSWKGQVVTTPWTRGIPMVVYPLTVAMVLSDGACVEFYNLERDVETLADALRYLVNKCGVTLEDPDDLLSHMPGGPLSAEELGDYLDRLYYGKSSVTRRETPGSHNQGEGR